MRYTFQDAIGREAARELERLVNQQQKWEEAANLTISHLVNRFTIEFEAGLDKLRSPVCQDCVKKCSFEKQMRNIHNLSCTRKVVELPITVRR